MRAVMAERQFDVERLKLAPPLAWAIAAAAIVTVFAIIVMIVNYAPLNRESEKRVESELPPATFDTVSALIKATGNACPRVCSVSPVSSLTPSGTLDVACAADGPRACSTPEHYRITVETAAGPQR